MKAVKKVLLSLAFPVLMFVVMLVITMNSDKCFVNGHNIFLGKDMVKQVVINSCMTVCVALAIWLQLKNGRFDFSGGASMVLAAIGAGYAGQQTGSMWTAFAVAVALGVVLSMGTAIICTIGMTLLYESLTYLLFGGQGIRGFYSTPTLSRMGRMPLVLLPAVLAMLIFVVYTYFTASGRRPSLR